MEKFLSGCPVPPPVATYSSGFFRYFIGAGRSSREAAINLWHARGTATELDTATGRFLWSGCCSLSLPGTWWRTAGRAAQSEPDHRNALRQGSKVSAGKTGLRVAAATAVQPGGKILTTNSTDDSDNERPGFLNENRHRFMLMQSMVQKFFPDCTLLEFPVKLGP